jgi:hypothetical protein
LFAFANHRKLQFEKNLENLTFSGNTLGDDEEEITEDTEDLRYNDRLTNVHIPKFTKCEKDFRILLGKLNVFQVCLALSTIFR